MSQENLELVRRFIESVGNGDYEAAAQRLDPGAEWHNTAVFPGPRTVVGSDAIVGFWRDFFDIQRGGSSGMKAEELMDGGEIVVVKVHGWGRGVGSGVPIDLRWAHILRLRDGKVIRVDTYGQFDRAVEVAGLSE